MFETTNQKLYLYPAPMAPNHSVVVNICFTIADAMGPRIGACSPDTEGKLLIHWIGLRENLQETHGFLPSNIGLSCKFSHNPIL